MAFTKESQPEVGWRSMETSLRLLCRDDKKCRVDIFAKILFAFFSPLRAICDIQSQIHA